MFKNYVNILQVIQITDLKIYRYILKVDLKYKFSR